LNTKEEIAQRIDQAVRVIPDFPKAGIQFRDITTLLQDAKLSQDVVEYLADQKKSTNPTAIIGIESRGFLFGPAVALSLGIPFVPVRKKGKLPGKTIEASYELEYGTATIEMHIDALAKGDKVWIHDDLLATGGTAIAAARLVKEAGAEVVGFSFLIDIELPNAKKRLEEITTNNIILLSAK